MELRIQAVLIQELKLLSHGYKIKKNKVAQQVLKQENRKMTLSEDYIFTSITFNLFHTSKYIIFSILIIITYS